MKLCHGRHVPMCPAPCNWAQFGQIMAHHSRHSPEPGPAQWKRWGLWGPRSQAAIWNIIIWNIVKAITLLLRLWWHRPSGSNGTELSKSLHLTPLAISPLTSHWQIKIIIANCLLSAKVGSASTHKVPGVCRACLEAEAPLPPSPGPVTTYLQLQSNARHYCRL